MWKTLDIAVRWLLRGLKRGDWLWLLFAVVMSSLTVSFVNLLSQTVQQSIEARAAVALGADGVLRSSRPIDSRWQAEAEALGLKTTSIVSLITMAQVETLPDATDKEGFNFQLVKLKAVPSSYPLRQVTALPTIEPGKVLLEEKLRYSLPQVTALVLGARRFELQAFYQPNAVEALNAFAPEVMIPIDALESTQLLGPASRVTYELSVAGESANVTKWLDILASENNAAWQVLSAKAPSDDIERTMDTAGLFLSLAALSAVIVAGLSILIASRFYLQAWQNTIALMRAFGASQNHIRAIFAWQLTALALLGGVIGVALGLLLFKVITPALADYFSPLIVVSYWPSALLGVVAGALVLWSFAWQAYRQVVNVSPMQVLKDVVVRTRLREQVVGLVLLVLLVWSLIGVEHLHWVLIGLLVTGMLFYGAAYLLWRVIYYWQPYSKGWLRVTLSSLQRSPNLLKIQLVSFGLVLFVLILMSFVRQDLLAQWQLSLGDDAPNAFVMNIQPDQLPAAKRVLEAFGLAPDMVAMARGRFTALNGEILNVEAQESNRARRLLGREVNVAFLEAVPDNNRVVVSSEGTMIESGVSVEQGVAALFSLKIGDQLQFDFSGQLMTLPVVSIREVVWQDFEMNFIFILPAHFQSEVSASYMTNFYVSEQGKEAGLVANLNSAVPGILFIDISVIMKQVQQMMAQASWAVTGLYVLTLFSSILVLFSATLASQKGRIQSWLLLKTLGATRRTMLKMGLMEFLLLGVMAGVLAATLAQVASGLMAVFLFNMPFQLHASLWLLSIALGGGSLLLIGWLTQRKYLTLSVVALKEQMHRF